MTSSWCQRIEAARSFDLAGKTVTLQFQTAYSGVPATFAARLSYINNGVGDNFASLTVAGNNPFTPSTVPGTYSTTFSVPTGALYGLQLDIFATIGGSGTLYWNLTNVQLELGSVATPFERLDPVLNLQRCQRFYVAKNVWGISYGLSGGTYGFGSDLPVFMHHLPTVNVASGAAYGNCSYSSITATASDKVALCVTVGTTGACTANAIVTASADL
jgi:hypothetical protein